MGYGEVSKFLREFKYSGNFEIADGKVNLFQSITLIKKNISSLPFPFGIVNGIFDISHNPIDNVNNFPTRVNIGLDISNTNISSIDNLNCEISGFINLSNSKIKNLDNLFNKVNYLKSIYISGLELDDLQFIPSSYKGKISIEYSKIKNLKDLNRFMNNVISVQDDDSELSIHIKFLRKVNECYKKILNG